MGNPNRSGDQPLHEAAYHLRSYLAVARLAAEILRRKTPAMPDGEKCYGYLLGALDRLAHTVDELESAAESERVSPLTSRR